MRVCFDTGILAKLYTLEVNSQDAVNLVLQYRVPIIFTHLHENELSNAIRLKYFRGEITAKEVSTALKTVRMDLLSGKLFRPSLDWADIWEKANDLSSRFAPQIGSRTLDTLHVAIALILGCSDFVSFDSRQRKLAIKAGLQVVP